MYIIPAESDDHIWDAKNIVWLLLLSYNALVNRSASVSNDNWFEPL